MSISDRGQTEEEREGTYARGMERDAESRSVETFNGGGKPSAALQQPAGEREVKELSVVPQVMISLRLDWNKCTRYSATVTSICYWTFMNR